MWVYVALIILLLNYSITEPFAGGNGGGHGGHGGHGGGHGGGGHGGGRHGGHGGASYGYNNSHVYGGSSSGWYWWPAYSYYVCETPEDYYYGNCVYIA